jgi:hypothetical protein
MGKTKKQNIIGNGSVEKSGGFSPDCFTAENYRSNIVSMLEDYHNNAGKLRDEAFYAYATDGEVGAAVEFLSSLFFLNPLITAKEFSDKQKLLDWFNKCHIKGIYRDIIRSVLIDGIVYLLYSRKKNIFTKLPVENVKTTLDGNYVYTNSLSENVTLKAEELLIVKAKDYGLPFILGVLSDLELKNLITNSLKTKVQKSGTNIIVVNFGNNLSSEKLEFMKSGISKAVEQNSKGKDVVLSFDEITKLSAHNINNPQTSVTDEKSPSLSAALGVSPALTGNEGGSFASANINLQMVFSYIFSIVEQITHQLNSKIISKFTAAKLYIPDFSRSNSDKQAAQMKELYLSGKGSLQAWVVSTGVPSDVYLSLMDEEKELGFDTKYTPHPTSYTMTSETYTDEGGRPTAKNSTNENTIKSQVNKVTELPRN